MTPTTPHGFGATCPGTPNPELTWPADIGGSIIVSPAPVRRHLSLNLVLIPSLPEGDYPPPACRHRHRFALSFTLPRIRRSSLVLSAEPFPIGDDHLPPPPLSSILPSATSSTVEDEGAVSILPLTPPESVASTSARKRKAADASATAVSSSAGESEESPGDRKRLRGTGTVASATRAPASRDPSPDPITEKEMNKRKRHKQNRGSPTSFTPSAPVEPPARASPFVIMRPIAPVIPVADTYHRYTSVTTRHELLLICANAVLLVVIFVILNALATVAQVNIAQQFTTTADIVTAPGFYVTTGIPMLLMCDCSFLCRLCCMWVRMSTVVLQATGRPG
jgi:hypothetical protein